MSEELKEIDLGYCPECDEYFWYFGKDNCPNYHCRSPKYTKITMREVKEGK